MALRRKRVNINDIENSELMVKVSYGPYSNVFFKALEGEHVILIDGNGQEKKVYTDLFMKHGKFLEEG